MRITLLVIAISGFLNAAAQRTEQNISDYKSYDFIAGEKTLFEDNLTGVINGSLPLNWNVEGGAASADSANGNKYISILQYYTKLTPKLKVKALPDVFTIEYDAWLDAGYDGNPGVEIVFLGSGEKDAVLTPNRDHVSCRFPEGEERGETPEEIRGENFYNKWNHISITYSKKSIRVYVNQFNVFSIADCKIVPQKILVTGNTSQDMKMLFRNFRIATDIPQSIAGDLAKGKFVTHAIRFDVNKATLKAESMGVINEVLKFLKTNPTINLEIDGYTDADGDDTSNLKLSEARAEAVKQQLIILGITPNRLTSKGFGEANPIDVNATAEGKANNRRVEFVKL